MVYFLVSVTKAEIICMGLGMNVLLLDVMIE